MERAASFVVLKEVIESRDSNVYDLDKREQRKSSGGNFNNRRSNYSRTKSKPPPGGTLLRVVLRFPFTRGRRLPP